MKSLSSFKKVLTVFVLGLFLTQSAYAQQDGDIFQESMTDIVTVAATGLGGAVLGLSTLSFVEEPSEHLNNIVVGGAIGIILGVGIVAWRQANKSAQYYNQQVLVPEMSSEFTTAMRSTWHRRNHFQVESNLVKNTAPSNSAVNFQFSF